MTTKIRHPEKVNKPINPIKKKPDWIRSKLLNSKEFFTTKTIINKSNLVTVCQEANCPNITECWSKRHATFMIMGDTCTRACGFCDVKTGKPEKLDPFEPFKISNAVKKLNKLTLIESNLMVKINNIEHKNSLLSEDIDEDYVDILIREKLMLGKKGESTYILIDNES